MKRNSLITIILTVIVNLFSLNALGAGICESYSFEGKKYKERVSQYENIRKHISNKKLINKLLKSENDLDENFFVEILATYTERNIDCIKSDSDFKTIFEDSDLLALVKSDTFLYSKYTGPTIVNELLQEAIEKKYLNQDELTLSANYHQLKKSLLWIKKGREEISRENYLQNLKSLNRDYTGSSSFTRLNPEVYDSFKNSKKKVLRGLKKRYYEIREANDFIGIYTTRAKVLADLLVKYPLFKYYQNDFDYIIFSKGITNTYNDDEYIEFALKMLNRKLNLISNNTYKEHINKEKSFSGLKSINNDILRHENKTNTLLESLKSKINSRNAIYKNYSNEKAIIDLVRAKRVYNLMHAATHGGRKLVDHPEVNIIKDVINNQYKSANQFRSKFYNDKNVFNTLNTDIKKQQLEFLEVYARSIYLEISLISIEAKLGLIDLNYELKSLLDKVARDLSQGFSPLKFSFDTSKFDSDNQNVEIQRALGVFSHFLKIAKANYKNIYTNELEVIDTQTDLLTKKAGRNPTGFFGSAGRFIGGAVNSIVDTGKCLIDNTFGKDCNPVDRMKEAFGDAKDSAKRGLEKAKKAASNIVADVAELGHDTGRVFKNVVKKTGVPKVVKKVTKEVVNVASKVEEGITHNIEELTDEARDFTTDLKHKPLDTLVKTAVNVTIAPVAVPIIAVSDPDSFITKPGESIDEFRKETGAKISTEVENGLENTGKFLSKANEVLEDNLENAWKDAVKLSHEAWDFSGEMIDKSKELAAKGVDIAQDVARFTTKPLRQLDKDTYDKLMDRLDGWSDHTVVSFFDMANPKRVYKVDTYRKNFNGHKKAIMETVRDVAKIHTSFSKALNEEVIKKISSDLAKEFDRVIALSNDGVDIVDATTSFENVTRTALLYVGSTVGGPAGTALANMLADRFIANKNMTEKDLLKSFAVGMTAGYAGELAASLANGGTVLSSTYSNVANSVTQDLGGVLLNNDSYSSKDLTQSLLTGMTAGVVGANNLGGNSIGNSSINSVNNYIITQSLNGESITVDEALRVSMRAATQAGLDEVVESNLSKMDLPNRLDKELYESVKKKLAEIGEDKKILTKELIALQHEDLKKALEELLALIKKHELGNSRDPAFVATTLAAISIGMTVYELYILSEKAINDQDLIEFIEYAQIHGVKKAMKNKDLAQIAEKYHGDILGVAVAAIGGPILKGLGKAASSSVVRKIMERIVVYGNKAMDPKFIKAVTDSVVKYKLNTAEKIDTFFDVATSMVKNERGSIQFVGEVVDSARKLGLKNVSDIKKNTGILQRWKPSFNKSKIDDALDINNELAKMGYSKPPYTSGSKVVTFKLTQPTDFVRVHGSNNKGGRWVMNKADIEGLSPVQIKDKYALPEVPTFVSDTKIPSGTSMRMGEVAPNYGSKGRGSQLEALDLIEFTNTRPIGDL
jgi:gas vesicle protein